MLIAGVPQPVPLAGVVGFLSLIPLVGATLGAVVVVTVAVFQSVPTAIGMAIFFIFAVQIPFYLAANNDVSSGQVGLALSLQTFVTYITSV